MKIKIFSLQGTLEHVGVPEKFLLKIFTLVLNFCTENFFTVFLFFQIGLKVTPNKSTKSIANQANLNRDSQLSTLRFVNIADHCAVLTSIELIYNILQEYGIEKIPAIVYFDKGGRPMSYLYQCVGFSGLPFFILFTLTGQEERCRICINTFFGTIPLYYAILQNNAGIGIFIWYGLSCSPLISIHIIR